MPIYNTDGGDYGYAAKMGRVNALRALEEAGVIEFQRYVPGSPPEFVITSIESRERRPTSREVPVYMLGISDLLAALQEALPDMINAAFAKPETVDRESLGEAILAELGDRYGEVRKCSDRFEALSLQAAS